MQQKLKNHNLILTNNTVVAKIPLTGSLNLSRFKLSKMLKTLHDWIIREQHRQYLLDLPDYLLDDIGLTRDQVVDEARKSFWQKGIF